MKLRLTIPARTRDLGLRIGHCSGWPAKNCRPLTVRTTGPDFIDEVIHAISFRSSCRGGAGALAEPGAGFVRPGSGAEPRARPGRTRPRAAAGGAADAPLAGWPNQFGAGSGRASRPLGSGPHEHPLGKTGYAHGLWTLRSRCAGTCRPVHGCKAQAQSDTVSTLGKGVVRLPRPNPERTLR